jgi:2-oxoglutarate ferredoxin oxidoreductase subunit alpha
LLACEDPTGDAEVLVLSWGSTYAAALAGVRRVRKTGGRVAHAHLIHLNPFPLNLGEIVKHYPRVLIPEGNLGQLAKLVRAEFLIDARSLSNMQGTPFRVAVVQAAINGLLEEVGSDTAGRTDEQAAAPSEGVA